METVEKYAEKFADLIIVYGARVVGAIVILIVGLWIIRRVVKTISKRMEKAEIDISLRPFLETLIGVVLKIVLFITVATMVGVQMTSFVAILGAAGLAIGLALQGSLSNFAGGILILILKPFKVGDFIDDGTNAGTVREIQIFYTYVTTFRNEEIIIPNGKLSNNAVKNSTYHERRRLDMLFGISYGDSMDKAIGLLKEIIEADERVLKEPAPVVFVETLNNSSVDIKVRMWIEIANYWAVYVDMTGKVKATFDANDITIPFPQRDVHMRQV